MGVLIMYQQSLGVSSAPTLVVLGATGHAQGVPTHLLLIASLAFVAIVLGSYLLTRGLKARA
jgi:hypothetical protein